MTNKILFSVVIPSYNRKKRLVRCLESVAANDLQDCEVIVVDDGSDDGTEEHIPRNFTWVRYVRQRNSGVSSARNHGMKIAGGEFIAFLDSDDIWNPKRLGILKNIVSTLPNEVSLIFNDMDKLIGGSGDGVSFSDNYFGALRRPVVECMDEISTVPLNDSHIDVRYGVIFDELIKGNIIQPSCTLLRRRVFQEDGGFREDFKVANDSEYFLRLARKHKVAYVPLILTTLEPPRMADSLSHRKNSIEKISNMIEAIHDHYNSCLDETLKTGLRTRMAGLQALRAYHFLSDLNTCDARKGYKESLSLNPLKLSYYFMWSVSCLPLPLLQVFGGCKRLLKRISNG